MPHHPARNKRGNPDHNRSAVRKRPHRHSSSHPGVRPSGGRAATRSAHARWNPGDSRAIESRASSHRQPGTHGPPLEDCSLKATVQPELSEQRPLLADSRRLKTSAPKSGTRFGHRGLPTGSASHEHPLARWHRTQNPFGTRYCHEVVIVAPRRKTPYIDPAPTAGLSLSSSCRTRQPLVPRISTLESADEPRPTDYTSYCPSTTDLPTRSGPTRSGNHQTETRDRVACSTRERPAQKQTTECRITRSANSRVDPAGYPSRAAGKLTPSQCNRTDQRLI